MFSFLCWEGVLVELAFVGQTDWVPCHQECKPSVLQQIGCNGCRMEGWHLWWEGTNYGISCGWIWLVPCDHKCKPSILQQTCTDGCTCWWGIEGLHFWWMRHKLLTVGLIFGTNFWVVWHFAITNTNLPSGSTIMYRWMYRQMKDRRFAFLMISHQLIDFYEGVWW